MLSGFSGVCILEVGFWGLKSRVQGLGLAASVQGLGVEG